MASPRHPPETDRQAKAILGIAVDLSDESAFAVKWSVQNYLRPGDTVILIHAFVRPVSCTELIGVRLIDHTVKDTDEEGKKKLDSDFDAFTIARLPAVET